MSTFTGLGVSAPVHEMLARRGINEPFAIQKVVMRDALAGKDVLAKSHTGSGKTLAFGIPLVENLEPGKRGPEALVLVPTRELAGQVVEELQDIARARNLRIAPVFGGVPLDRQAKKASTANIVVATPGRMTDLLNRRMISVGAVRILVLDEADRMLDMGFQPQVDDIVDRLKGPRQTLFFSATLDGRVGHLARSYTVDPVRHEIAETRPIIEEAHHRFVPVDQHGKVQALISLLGEERDLALVFVRTKRGADRLRHKLKAKGVRAGSMHGDMSQNQRRRALDQFSQGRIDVLIATDVAARGLDLDGITHVVNFDPPHDHKDYVHRVGRTARAGRSGTGVTFVSPAQQQEVSVIARALELKDEFQADGLRLSAPAKVYSSHGRRSSMRPPRKRRRR